MNMVFGSCTKQEKTANYSISTKFNIQSNGESINCVYNDSGVIEAELKITYISDIDFTLEIGLIDNYNQRSFEMKNKDEYFTDDVFCIKLPSTDNEFKESTFNIRVNNLQNNNHDLLFWVKNVETLRNDSIRAYNFLRLAVMAPSDNSGFDYSTEILFAPDIEKNVFLELNPSAEKRLSSLYCTLQINLSKIYNEDAFITEYNEHKNENIDFVIMVLENNKLLKINGKDYYAYCKSIIGQDGKVDFVAASNKSDNEELVFIVVPYPFLDVENAQRYQMLAYNNICYYQYKFDESVELLTGAE